MVEFHLSFVYVGVLIILIAFLIIGVWVIPKIFTGFVYVVLLFLYSKTNQINFIACICTLYSYSR